MSEYPFEIGLSYSEKDSDKAKLLSDKLHLLELQLHEAKLGSYIGFDRRTNLQQKFRNIMLVVVFISEDYVFSSDCLEEWEIILRESDLRSYCFWIPIRIDSTSMDQFPNSIQYLDWEEGVAELAISIFSILHHRNKEIGSGSKPIPEIELTKTSKKLKKTIKKLRKQQGGDSGISIKGGINSSGSVNISQDNTSD